MASSSHVMGVGQQVFSGWVRHSSVEEVAEENPDSHMDTVTWDSVAGRKIGQFN